MKNWLAVAVMAGAMLSVTEVGAKEETVPYQIAREEGVKQCLGAVRKVSEFLVGGKKHRARCVWKTGAADKAPFSCVIESDDSGPTMLDTMNVAPQASGGCTMEYTRMAAFSKDCDQIHDTVLVDFQEERGPWKHFREFKGSKGNAYTTRLAGGCLVMRRETLF